MNFESVIFVLVGTTHSGNIGAAARAMKTMGFHKLRLVDCCPHRTGEALARASGANALIEEAEVFESLDGAVGDCQYVYGTSARIRYLSVPLVTAEEAAGSIAQDLNAAVSQQESTSEEDKVQVAIVFGRERTGLSNEELDRCTRLLNIPVNPNFSSLNLGSAVQVVAYEISKALNRAEHPVEVEPLDANAADDSVQQTDRSAPANSHTMTLFFEHMERALTTIGFLDPNNPRLLMRRLRGYYERNRPDMTEMSILRGILSASENPHPRPPRSPKDDQP